MEENKVSLETSTTVETVQRVSVTENVEPPIKPQEVKPYMKDVNPTLVPFNTLDAAEKLYNQVFEVTDKSPNRMRRDMTSKIRDKTQYILELIVRANCCAIDSEGTTKESVIERITYQKQIRPELSILNVLLDAYHQIGGITETNLETLPIKLIHYTI